MERDKTILKFRWNCRTHNKSEAGGPTLPESRLIIKLQESRFQCKVRLMKLNKESRSRHTEVDVAEGANPSGEEGQVCHTVLGPLGARG